MANDAVRIRMRTLAAGESGARYPGKEYLVSAREAAELLAGNYADRVSLPPVPEAAALKTPERAVPIAPQKRKGK